MVNSSVRKLQFQKIGPRRKKMAYSFSMTIPEIAVSHKMVKVVSFSYIRKEQRFGWASFGAKYADATALPAITQGNPCYNLY
jgi:hypothetical protein